MIYFQNNPIFTFSIEGRCGVVRGFPHGGACFPVTKATTLHSDADDVTGIVPWVARHFAKNHCVELVYPLREGIAAYGALMQRVRLVETAA